MRPTTRVALIIVLATALLGCSLLTRSCGSGDYVDEPVETRETETGPTVPDETLLSVETVRAVHNGGEPPTFEIETPYRITEIMTYHWNGGTGVGPGEISIEAEDGMVYGPWEASGDPGKDDAQDAYWWAYPEEVLPAGTYTLLVSDPKTWAQNDETQGFGIAMVSGVPVE